MNTNDDYIVYIIENPEDDFLSPVDLRTLDADRLAALRAEAVSTGHGDMVAAIDRATR